MFLLLLISKMKISSIIIIIIIFLLITGGIIFLYFRFEKPRQEERREFVNLNILAEYNDELVKTGYTVFVNNSYYTEGETSDRAAVSIRIPVNSTIRVINKNIENQSFYENEEFTTTFINEPKRITLKLVSFGYLNITQTGNLGEDTRINLSILSEGYFKNMTICLDWSNHILLAKIENIPKTEKIDKNAKCFSSKTLEKNDRLNITIMYNSFGILNENDFINVSFYDFEKNYILRQFYKINTFI